MMMNILKELQIKLRWYYAKRMSPCKKECQLIHTPINMICNQCGRTQEEIITWSTLSKKEIDNILERLNNDIH